MRTAIHFGGALFEGPYPIGEWTPPASAGIYCLMVPDPRRAPLPYRAIYFGQSSNFAEQGFPAADDGYASWLLIADYELSIHIAGHWMRWSTLEERQALERELIRLYKPECNEAVRERSLLTH